MQKLRVFISKSRYALAGALFALTVVSAGAASIAQPGAASAASCDDVNIIRCGLNGGNLAGYTNSFQNFYDRGSDSGHNDLEAVFRWSGATDATVHGMNSSNTKLGTLYRDGDIKVNGMLVGHDAWVSARFGANQSGFTHIEGDVWARKTTTSFAESSATVLVHFDTNGNADFAVMTTCGNSVKFIPKIQPKPALDCINLAASEVGATRKFNFRARATAQNTTISKYVFAYGDGANDSVNTSSATANASHTYSQDDHSFTARVTVYSNDFSGGKTSSNCNVTVKTPTPKPALVCESLSYATTGEARTYTFTAHATASNTTINNYVFTINDGTNTVTKTVTTSSDTAQLTYTFPKDSTNYNVKVVVNGKDLTNITSSTCAVNLTTAGPNECKPGIPVGDQRCTECKPGVPQGSAECQPPVTLANTGPGGMFAAFAGVTTIGAIAHRFFQQRRKMGY